MKHELGEDFEHILMQTGDLWKEIAGKRIFLTGGTGFFGTWLQLSFIYINRKLELNAALTVLTRNRQAFAEKHPDLANSHDISFVEGDICSFDFPPENIDFIIHAATDASIKLNAENPLAMFDTVVNGTKRVLELAAEKNVRSLLLTSSGAVYGVQPPEIESLQEDFTGGPVITDISGMYAEGKRMAEILCAVYRQQKNIPVKIARCFAFIGPYLPQDAHFAAGNFIGDAVQGKDIDIKGDGTPVRSYLYASDLVVWLWTILLKGEANRPYNVGSDQQINIAELANKIAAHTTPAGIKVNIAIPKNENAKPARYTPDITRAKSELGLNAWIDLDSAIKKTLTFYKNKR